MLPQHCRAAVLGFLLSIGSPAPAVAQATYSLTEAASAQARGDHLRAFQILLPLAQGGQPEAQVRLGLIYYHGLGVREDDLEAFGWFGRAAALGHADGQYHLANLYAFGNVPPQHAEDGDREAARWYFAAAQQGHADAQYGLAILFSAGKGVLQDPGEAMKWFRRAAAGGHRDAQRFIEGQ